MNAAVFVLILASTCLTCHSELKARFAEDTHSRKGLTCTACHGGVEGPLEMEAAHGKDFRGVPERSQIPRLCANCHSDPEKMRPFSLPIDQYLYYQSSYHGRALARGDTRVAVCTDCHGTHDIRPAQDPRSRVYRENIADTCGRCHAQRELMERYGLSADVVDQYRAGVHFQALASGHPRAPHCATCHGKHGAAPPNVQEVSEVCGLCHTRSLEMFLQSPHARAFPGRGLPACVACHDNHATARVDPERIVDLCGKCHETGQRPLKVAAEIQTLLKTATADLQEAQTALEAARAVGVPTRAMEERLEEARTFLSGVQPVVHSLRVGDIEAETRKVRSIAGEIRSEVQRWRGHRTAQRFLLIAFWFYLLLTVALLEIRRAGLSGEKPPPEGPSDERGSVRWGALWLMVGLGGLLLTVFLLMQVSSTPAFCGSCHVMQPYYQSWKASTHRSVPCVDCHIPPGITSEFRKKYEALSMAVQYITQTYGPNPWAEVEDASCLRCHERRLLQGKEVFHDIVFDHAPHLLELRRGMRLRCTSCHSQIVQGLHITVTESTCFLCHFKNQRLGVGPARCELCHIPPAGPVEAQGVRFDHGDVRRFGMECVWCHQRSIRGEGAVPRERCLTCHNEPQRLARFGDEAYLHQMHVTEHKVECTDCHQEIQHGRLPLTPAATACERCHLSGHAPTRDLYAGLGGKGVPPRPSKMFLTGVDCEGCHFLEHAARGGLRGANEVSCMACHGTRYRKVYLQWKTVLERALRDVETAYASAVRWAPDAPVLQDVKANLEFVRQANGIHNPDYALALLAWSYRQIQETVQGRPVRLPAWVQVPYTSSCMNCHQGIELQTASYRGYTFSHAKHITVQALTCETCHRPHEVREPAEVLRPGLACSPCHHAPEVRRACQDCHGLGPSGDLRLADRRTFPHRLHASPEDLDLACGTCHAAGRLRPDPKVCQECHE